MLLTLLILFLLTNCTVTAIVLVLAIDKPATDPARRPLLALGGLLLLNTVLFLTLYAHYAHGISN